MTNRRDEMDTMESIIRKAVWEVEEVPCFIYKGESFDKEAAAILFASIFDVYSFVYGEDEATEKKPFFVKFARYYHADR
jgi:hypothetical protein